MQIYFGVLNKHSFLTYLIILEFQGYGSEEYTWENVPFDTCAKQRFKPTYAHVQTYQSICCQQEESLYLWL